MIYWKVKEKQMTSSFAFISTQKEDSTLFSFCVNGECTLLIRLIISIWFFKEWGNNNWKRTHIVSLHNILWHSMILLGLQKLSVKWQYSFLCVWHAVGDNVRINIWHKSTRNDKIINDEKNRIKPVETIFGWIDAIFRILSFTTNRSRRRTSAANFGHLGSVIVAHRPSISLVNRLVYGLDRHLYKMIDLSLTVSPW